MADRATIGVVIAAAGAGLRTGGVEPKQWRPLGGRTMIDWAWRSFLPDSLDRAQQVSRVSRIVLVVDSAHRDRAAAEFASPDVATSVVEGGATRMESVRKGLACIPGDTDLIAVHDAARPFWPVSLWDDLIGALAVADGAVPAVAVGDTLKRAGDDGCRTVDRHDLWAAQTPQVFRQAILRQAHDAAAREGFSGTDDAELVERAGGRVALVASRTTNLKITTPEDWALAERLVGQAANIETRTGLGYDAHRLGAEGPLMIGGVRLAETGGLIGHSDGDVLLHAICDALLGAAALGDIGRHFPPGDERLAGVNSRVLLRRTREILAEAGFLPRQIDSVVIAEAPRLAPHIEAMRAVIAEDLRVMPAMVSVKATTADKMGFVGRGEGIAAEAVATIAISDLPGHEQVA